MQRKRIIMDIFESGTVEIATEEDARVDQYSALSSDIDAMLAHLRGVYFEVLKSFHGSLS